jgi:hypothetical protein
MQAFNDHWRMGETPSRQYPQHRWVLLAPLLEDESWETRTHMYICWVPISYMSDKYYPIIAPGPKKYRLGRFRRIDMLDEGRLVLLNPDLHPHEGPYPDFADNPDTGLHILAATGADVPIYWTTRSESAR